MKAEYYYHVFSTPLGYIGLVKSSCGLREIILPQKTSQQVLRLLKRKYGRDLVKNKSKFKLLEYKIGQYLRGKRISFDEKIDLRGVSLFGRRVLLTTIKILFGEVESYSSIAKNIGSPRSARAVGRVLSSNRIPIVIPCHRAIMKSGKLGGFSGGSNMKRLLIALEERKT